MNNSKEKLERAEALLKEVKSELPVESTKHLLDELDSFKRKMYVVKLLSTLLKELSTDDAITTHYLEKDGMGLISSRDNYWTGLKGTKDYDITIRSASLGTIDIKGSK